MSRFKHLVIQETTTTETSDTPKLVGLFPFNTLVDPKTSDIHAGKIDFLVSGGEALRELARKNYSVVLFINQFKQRPLPMEHFQGLNQAIDNFVKQSGTTIAGLYWTPGSAKADPFVVPNAGMFNRATENQGINWTDIPVLSTYDADLLAATKVGALPIKIGNGSEKWTHFDSLFEWTKSL